MITDAVIAFFLRAFTALVSALPPIPIDLPALVGMGASVGDATARADGYFPIVFTLTCVGVVLAVRIALFAWRTAIFIYHQFWGSN